MCETKVLIIKIKMQNTLGKLKFLYTGIFNVDNDAGIGAQGQVKGPGLRWGGPPPGTH